MKASTHILRISVCRDELNKSETVQEAWSEQFRGLFLYVDACNRQHIYPEQKLPPILLHSPES